MAHGSKVATLRHVGKCRMSQMQVVYNCLWIRYGIPFAIFNYTQQGLELRQPTRGDTKTGTQEFAAVPLTAALPVQKLPAAVCTGARRTPRHSNQAAEMDSVAHAATPCSRPLTFPSVAHEQASGETDALSRSYDTLLTPPRCMSRTQSHRCTRHCLQPRPAARCRWKHHPTALLMTA